MTVAFVDPETHEPLVQADAATLERLRDALRSGRGKRADAAAVGAFDGAYLTEDGRRAYLVVDGIPTFLLDERIELLPPLEPS